MPRAKTILQADYPYSIGARCINKDWFKLPIDIIWQIMSNQLYFFHHAFNAKIHSFVLMSNHFHALVSTPDSNLDKIMAHFMKETSRDITKLSGRINQTYGSRYYKTVISKYHYFLNSYKYIYRNPVEAGLSKGVESYKYSSLNGLIGQNPLLFPVIEDTILFADINKTLDWLNTSVKPEDLFSMKSALKKNKFKLRKNPSNGKPNGLENDML